MLNQRQQWYHAGMAPDMEFAKANLFDMMEMGAISAAELASAIRAIEPQTRRSRAIRPESVRHPNRDKAEARRERQISGWIAIGFSRQEAVRQVAVETWRQVERAASAGARTKDIASVMAVSVGYLPQRRDKHRNMMRAKSPIAEICSGGPGAAMIGWLKLEYRRAAVARHQAAELRARAALLESKATALEQGATVGLGWKP